MWVEVLCNYPKQHHLSESPRKELNHAAKETKKYVTHLRNIEYMY